MNVRCHTWHRPLCFHSECKYSHSYIQAAKPFSKNEDVLAFVKKQMFRRRTATRREGLKSCISSINHCLVQLEKTQSTWSCMQTSELKTTPFLHPSGCSPLRVWEKVLSAYHNLPDCVMRLRAIHRADHLSFEDYVNISSENTGTSMERASQSSTSFSTSCTSSLAMKLTAGRK